MTRYVIDASVAIKWFVDEDGSAQALALAGAHRLVAPDLLVAECANILWKKVRKSNMSAEASLLAARMLERADIELVPTRHLLTRSLELAIELERAACDCIYLALAASTGCPFVTADENLLRKTGHGRAKGLGFAILSLAAAAAG